MSNSRIADRELKNTSKWGRKRIVQARFDRALKLAITDKKIAETRIRNKTLAEKEQAAAERSERARLLALSTMSPYMRECREAKLRAGAQPVQQPLRPAGIPEALAEMRRRMAALVHPDDAAQDAHVNAVLRA